MSRKLPSQVLPRDLQFFHDLPFSEPANIEIRNVSFTEPDWTGFRIVKSLDELDACRFTATGWSDQSNSFSFPDTQI